jgi:hypothetical protein
MPFCAIVNNVDKTFEAKRGTAKGTAASETCIIGIGRASLFSPSCMLNRL